MNSKYINRTAAGFAHVGIVIAVIIIAAAISFVGFRVYQNSSATSTPPASPASPNPAPAPAATPAPTPTPTPSLSGDTGLRGYGVIYPSAPVCTGNCTTKYKNTFDISIVDVNSQKKIAATITSDANGEFSTNLAPGTYTLQATNSDGMSHKPQQVTIEKGKVTSVVITFDSGIR